MHVHIFSLKNSDINLKETKAEMIATTCSSSTYGGGGGCQDDEYYNRRQSGGVDEERESVVTDSQHSAQQEQDSTDENDESDKSMREHAEGTYSGSSCTLASEGTQNTGGGRDPVCGGIAALMKPTHLLRSSCGGILNCSRGGKLKSYLHNCIKLAFIKTNKSPIAIFCSGLLKILTISTRLIIT